MNIRNLIVILALAALGLPFTAQADTSAWYLAADVGQAHYSGVSGQAPAVGTSHVSDSDTGYRFTGGYQFNEYWGLEASYVDFGQAETNVTVTTPVAGALSGKRQDHGFVFAGTGTYPFSDNWSGFLRFGTIIGHVQNKVAGTGSLSTSTVDQSSTDWKITYGIGVNWKVADNWILRAGWDQYSSLGNQNKTGENDINLMSVGIEYRF